MVHARRPGDLEHIACMHARRREMDGTFTFSLKGRLQAAGCRLRGDVNECGSDRMGVTPSTIIPKTHSEYGRTRKKASSHSTIRHLIHLDHSIHTIHYATPALLASIRHQVQTPLCSTASRSRASPEPASANQAGRLASERRIMAINRRRSSSSHDATVPYPPSKQASH